MSVQLDSLLPPGGETGQREVCRYLRETHLSVQIDSLLPPGGKIGH